MPAFTLISVYWQTGDHQSAREVAAESAQFLEAEDTKAAIGRIPGAESFYEYLQELKVAET